MKYLIKKPDTFLNILNDDINAIVQRSFNNIFPEYIFQKDLNGFAMPVDIKEYDDKYLLKAELPGIKKEDIKIDVEKSYIKIEATKEISKEDDDKHKYHKSEFKYGNYSRTLYFPYEADPDKAEASLKNGILEITLPKLKVEDKEAKKLEIKD